MIIGSPRNPFAPKPPAPSAYERLRYGRLTPPEHGPLGRPARRPGVPATRATSAPASRPTAVASFGAPPVQAPGPVTFFSVAPAKPTPAAAVTRPAARPRVPAPTTAADPLREPQPLLGR